MTTNDAPRWINVIIRNVITVTWLPMWSMWSSRSCQSCGTQFWSKATSNYCSRCTGYSIALLPPPLPPLLPLILRDPRRNSRNWEGFTYVHVPQSFTVKTYGMPPPTAIASDPDPAMPLQPRTPRTDSFLQPLGSYSNPNSNLSLLLRLQTERIHQRDPIRLAKFRALDLPFPDLPRLPCEYERQEQLSYSQSTSLQQQQPPPSTSARIWRSSAAPPYIPQSQQSSSRPAIPVPTTLPTPTKTPDVDWTNSSPPGPPPSPSIRIPLTQFPPSSTPHYPPERFSPPSILEDPEKLEKALRVVSKPVYLMLSISAALLNVNAFSTNSITKVPLMIATTTSFVAVTIHWMMTLQLHVSQSVHHIKRSLVLLVASLAVSVIATLFTLPAHSWSQEECNPFCWTERALVSTVVIGGFASLIIGGWRMRAGDGRLAARV